MLNDFDIVNLPSGGYELVNGHSTMRVEFSNDKEKSLFDMVVTQRNKDSASLVRAMIKAHGKEDTLSFFNKLRAAGIVYYDDTDTLQKGRTFGRTESHEFKLLEAAARPMAIISASPLAAMLRTHEILANAKILDASKLVRASTLEATLAPFEFIVVDASSYNPSLLDRINRFAAAAGKPWLLVQGVYERSGHVGPLFFGRDTGCYQCFRDRMHSNANAAETFKRYETWLAENGTLSQPAALPSTTFNRQIAVIAAMEVEKFLLEHDIPQTYGYLLSIDPRSYSVEQHRLYKTPFCEVCNRNFEYRRAPWLDSITLSAA